MNKSMECVAYLFAPEGLEKLDFGIVTMVNFAFAILLSISRTVAGLTDKQNANQEDQDLPENLRAENPSLLINYTNVWK